MSFDLTYQRAEGPSGGAEPGTVALMAYLTSRFDGTWNGGIYNPRKVRGGSSWSIHAEGRAGDLMVPGGYDGSDVGFALGSAAADWLVDNAERLGVQQVIWWERDWRAGQGWTDYGGSHPHRDHVHFEQVREAAAMLTGADIATETTETAKLNSPIVGAAGHPSGAGYWMVAADGGIFGFGVCQDLFFGSLGDQVLNEPIVGMACTLSGNGYWLFAADGGVFAFGDADYHGSVPEVLAG